MLTSLPAELRLKVLRLSIGEHVFHISSTLKDGREDNSELTVTHAERSCCGHSRQRNLSALASTCRLLFNEATEVLYGLTRIVFTSTEAAATFFQRRNRAFEYVNLLSLHCGPAKHLRPSQKKNKRELFRLLRDRAQRLSHLHLCFQPYYGIDQDQQLLSDFWHRNLDRLRGLKEFSMDVSLDLMGPISASHVSVDMQARVKVKVHHVEKTLRERLCQPIYEQHVHGHSLSV